MHLAPEDLRTGDRMNKLRNDLVQISFVYSNFDDFDLIVVDSRVRGRGGGRDEPRRVGG